MKGKRVKLLTSNDHVGIVNILVPIAVFISPLYSTLLAVSFLVIVDLLTGIWASKKRGEPVSSNGIRRTISKTLAYHLVIITSYIIEKYLLLGIPILKTVVGLITISEVQSFFENIYFITDVDLWEKFINLIHGGIFKNKR